MKNILLTALSIICITVFGSCKNSSSETTAKTPNKMEAKKSCCSGDNSTKESISDNTSDTKVIYFHFSRRCITCMSVEKTAKNTVQDLGDEKTNFLSLNLEKKGIAEIAKKYGVGGQALIVVKNGKIVNLTNYAFMNAKTKPEKLKEKIINTIKTL